MTKALLDARLKYGGRLWEFEAVDTDEIDDGTLYVRFREVEPKN